LFYNTANINKAVLSPEFNLKISEPVHISGYAKILHGYHKEDWMENPAALAYFLNKSQDNRVWLPAEGLRCLQGGPNYYSYQIPLSESEKSMKNIATSFMEHFNIWPA
jgi:hypothetical protein